MAEGIQERVTAEELFALPLFEGESPDAVAWIASQLTVRRFEAGVTIFRQDEVADVFVIILSGEIHFQRTAFDDILIAPAGQATGILPFSRMKTWTGRGWAAQDTRVATMSAEHNRELVYRAPVVAQRLVTEMTERTRRFTRMEEGSNRLLALGKLSAGLAHELNNPASAAVRSSARLRTVLAERRKLALSLRAENLSEAAREKLAQLGESIMECTDTPGALDPLEQSDREADLSDRLLGAGLPEELASGLVAAGITAEDLQPLIRDVSPQRLASSLRILIADHEILCLTRELEEASRRVSDLVKAVKSYSYMDQTPMAEVDIEQGLDVTLRMFQHQIKQGVQVVRQFAGDLPRIQANGSALNQVWTNLIDNALHAMASLPSGAPRVLTVRTHLEPTWMLVEIGDNGPGIPADVQQRMFEPFFTTKAVGEGTGLGLDIVKRIIRSHKAVIRVDSEPGRTVFQIRIPLART